MEMMNKAIEDGQQQWLDELLAEKQATDAKQLSYEVGNRKQRRAIAAIQRKHNEKGKRHV